MFGQAGDDPAKAEHVPTQELEKDMLPSTSTPDSPLGFSPDPSDTSTASGAGAISTPRHIFPMDDKRAGLVLGGTMFLSSLNPCTVTGETQFLRAVTAPDDAGGEGVATSKADMLMPPDLDIILNDGPRFMYAGPQKSWQNALQLLMLQTTARYMSGSVMVCGWVIVFG